MKQETEKTEFKPGTEPVVRKFFRGMRQRYGQAWINLTRIGGEYGPNSVWGWCMWADTLDLSGPMLRKILASLGGSRRAPDIEDFKGAIWDLKPQAFANVPPARRRPAPCPVLPPDSYTEGQDNSARMKPGQTANPATGETIPDGDPAPDDNDVVPCPERFKAMWSGRNGRNSGPDPLEWARRPRTWLAWQSLTRLCESDLATHAMRDILEGHVQAGRITAEGKPVMVWQVFRHWDGERGFFADGDWVPAVQAAT